MWWEVIVLAPFVCGLIALLIAVLVLWVVEIQGPTAHQVGVVSRSWVEKSWGRWSDSFVAVFSMDDGRSVQMYTEAPLPLGLRHDVWSYASGRSYLAPVDEDRWYVVGLPVAGAGGSIGVGVWFAWRLRTARRIGALTRGDFPVRGLAVARVLDADSPWQLQPDRGKLPFSRSPWQDLSLSVKGGETIDGTAEGRKVRVVVLDNGHRRGPVAFEGTVACMVSDRPADGACLVRSREGEWIPARMVTRRGEKDRPSSGRDFA